MRVKHDAVLGKADLELDSLVVPKPKPKKARGCRCGYPNKKPLTLKQVAQWSALRGRPIVVCRLCGHEVGPINTAHDVRKLSVFGESLAHKACVKHFNLTPKKPGNAALIVLRDPEAR